LTALASNPTNGAVEAITEKKNAGRSIDGESQRPLIR